MQHPGLKIKWGEKILNGGPSTTGPRWWRPWFKGPRQILRKGPKTSPLRKVDADNVDFFHISIYELKSKQCKN